MKKFALTVLLLTLCLMGRAQDDMLERIIEVNSPKSLEANWTQLRHSPLLVEDLRSSGSVVLREPSYLKWEVKEPVASVKEMGTQDKGRFRTPTIKDFKASIQADGTVVLEPVRRDLKQLFRRLTLTVDPATLLVKSVYMEGTDDGWTKIDFKDIKTQ